MLRTCPHWSPPLLLPCAVRMHHKAYGVVWIVWQHIANVVDAKTCSCCACHAKSWHVEKENYAKISRIIAQLSHLVPDPLSRWWHDCGISFPNLSWKEGHVLLQKFSNRGPGPLMTVLKWTTIPNLNSVSPLHATLSMVLKLIHKLGACFGAFLFEPEGWNWWLNIMPASGDPEQRSIN